MKIELQNKKLVTEQKVSINDINVTLKFAENPKVGTHDRIMEILLDSYQSRIVKKPSLEAQTKAELFM